MSKSVARQFKWEVGRDFPFWCAQYKKTPPTTYTDNPWTDTKGWGPWTGCKILQYSSKGRLSGYNADLDLDKAFMDGNEWMTYAGGKVVIEDKVDDILTPTLRYGDKNEYVRSWQTYLNNHAYNCGDADGWFGDKTLKALLKWQQDHGMEAGYIGPKTWETIL